MDCLKNGCSIETARENEVVVESSSRKRFYECMFCKRGFTNAQALGGHMNIHRKDRGRIGSAPRRQAHSSSSPSSRYHALATKPYYSARKTNTCPSKYMRRDYEILADDLSLKIGSGQEEDMDLGEIIKNEEHDGDEIDLELRLGYCC